MLGKLVFGGTPYLKLRRDNGCRTGRWVRRPRAIAPHAGGL